MTYGAAISAGGKGKQWQCTLELVEDMRSQGVPADVIPYTRRQHLREGQTPGRALELFEAMCLEGLQANVITYNATVSSQGLQQT